MSRWIVPFVLLVFCLVMLRAIVWMLDELSGGQHK